LKSLDRLVEDLQFSSFRVFILSCLAHLGFGSAAPGYSWLNSSVFLASGESRSARSLVYRQGHPGRKSVLISVSFKLRNFNPYSIIQREYRTRVKQKVADERNFTIKKIRTALIGCGKVGGIHARALKAIPDSDFAAVCDASAERAQAFASQFGVAPFTDVPSMIRSAGIEAATIATPHPLHAEPAIRCAEAGVHVLIEKPLAASLADCDAMIDAAKKAGTTLGVISQRRFFEPVRRMRAAIDAGKIGRPILGVFQMYSWRDEAYYRSDPWRGKWATEGGGVLVNQSPHMLDMLQWFMGEIDEITGCWGNLNHPYIEVEDTALAMVRFKNGGLGSIVASLSQRPGIYTKVHIHGSNGASVGVETDRGATFVAGMSSIAEPPLNDVWTIPGEEHLLARFQEEDRAHFKTIDATEHYHRLQIEDFLRAIVDKRPPAVTGEEGRIVVEMFSAIYRSSAERKPIKT
jgi:predicted dehydrogenase